MPIHFTGTVEDRYAKLDRSGRRCDANGRRCVGAAVERFVLLKTDGFGTVLGEPPVQRQCCSRHRLQFTQNGFYQVVSREPVTPVQAKGRVA